MCSCRHVHYHAHMRYTYILYLCMSDLVHTVSLKPAITVATKAQHAADTLNRAFNMFCSLTTQVLIGAKAPHHPPARHEEGKDRYQNIYHRHVPSWPEHLCSSTDFQHKFLLYVD